MGTLTPEDTSTPPSDYGDLYVKYYDYVAALCVRWGIRQEASEDAASDILLKFMEKDFLAKYDASITVEGRKTKFISFLSGFVSKYVLALRDKQMTRDRKETHRTEQPIGEDGTPWIDVFGPSHEDTTPELDYEETVACLFDHLRSKPQRGTRNLPRALEITIETLAEADGPHASPRAAIAEEFGVSPTAVHLLFGDLRAECREALERN